MRGTAAAGQVLGDETLPILAFRNLEIVPLFQNGAEVADAAEFAITGHRTGKPIALAFAVFQVELRVRAARDPNRAGRDFADAAERDE